MQSVLKKREKKLEEKTEKKTVQFSESIQTHVIGERRWNDSKLDKDRFKKGNFTDDEVKKLMHSLC